VVHCILQHTTLGVVYNVGLSYFRKGGALQQLPMPIPFSTSILCAPLTMLKMRGCVCMLQLGVVYNLGSLYYRKGGALLHLPMPIPFSTSMLCTCDNAENAWWWLQICHTVMHSVGNQVLFVTSSLVGNDAKCGDRVNTVSNIRQFPL
jgi:hypothetical protein